VKLSKLSHLLILCLLAAFPAFGQAPAPKTLEAAQTLHDQGVKTAQQGQLEEGGKLLREALAIREELVPGSVLVAKTLNSLGVVARRSGDLDAAEDYLNRAEEILRRLAPESDDYGKCLMNLGNLAGNRGDLEQAETLQRQALATFEKVDPANGIIVGSLHNLVGLTIQRGDLAAAEELLRRILTFHEGKGTEPEGWEVWYALANLGNLALWRRDPETAQTFYERALPAAEKLNLQGWEVADTLNSLGMAALQKGDFKAARSWMRRAQEITERVEPESINAAESLRDLARIEIDGGGDLAAAERSLGRAMALLEKKAPQSLTAASVLRAQGEIAARRGRLREAIGLHQRAVSIQSRLAPGTTEEAVALYHLGLAERRSGRSQEGVRDLCRAVDVFDRQRSRLGGTPEAKDSFEASLGDYYQACLEGLLDLGRPAEAFHVLERGRARSFLALLAERDVRLQGLPPKLAAERGRVNAEYDRVVSQLASLSAGRDDAEIERLTGRLRDLRTRQEEILVKIRRESPRSAALQDPQPLDLAGVRAALDPGTVLLEYAVGREKSWLFAVQPAGTGGSGLSVFPIALGAKKLRKEVESFRLLLKDPGSSTTEIQARARRLYEGLVRPAEARMAGAKRILVSADGPLHTLPFAALRSGNRYLVERKPVYSVLSATVYGELTRSRPSRHDPEEERLAAFGDPVYRPLTPETAADPNVREAVRRGLDLRPLPLSGREVKSIAALYPNARVYTGRDATEEKAKSLGPDSSLVHFACHGVLDERFPLNSALVLTLPEPKAEGRENGLLQAWEIFEGVRLDADLVTLSACDTALGREMAGEGLVGLTRAFQYAGARSVVATLWGVADLSTARFMESFYGYLRAGKTKDEALRAAQIDQIRKKTGASHPFHWAAFQLTGDWR